MAWFPSITSISASRASPRRFGSFMSWLASAPCRAQQMLLHFKSRFARIRFVASSASHQLSSHSASFLCTVLALGSRFRANSLCLLRRSVVRRYVCVLAQSSRVLLASLHFRSSARLVDLRAVFGVSFPFSKRRQFVTSLPAAAFGSLCDSAPLALPSSS